ncbi:similar to Saccharomyces cerevisiae YOR110W TFC7 One of six subunits of the RNA polymerase III transcription initiation factor complex (TFIIIC) [Maudiozyma saulgeensis]|uniref:Similar to Saccharomyces cerevisiae YOR110W TFC7 One of six subunits of the RNA polymerase III transcription initiation factor complex (TFIIIC) n=1 Tax=Maudiozyma saulgeensis TaxID=1789683 RepID=A0A1X7QZW9_9SACH|nr:similar to Saccharomyces cerevisiae YOR110W TFC7 One of six subunits of the RNA polymerase III transcription initiation factor complex (TFIIIC) [Kazachstania saulgeensis]
MVVKNIYISRHAHSSAWLPEDQQPLSRTGIPNDLPLTEHGVNQSMELAHYILSVDTQPDIIIASPFYSCVETSKYIANLLDIPVYLDKGLGNWFNTENEKGTTPTDFNTLNSLFPGVLKNDWGNGSTVEPLKDGETKVELYSRSASFITNMLEKLNKEHPDVETVLLMTHAPVKIAIGMNILKLKSWDTPLDEDGNVLQASVCSLDKYQWNKLDEEDEEDEEDKEERQDSNSNVESIKWIMTMNNNTEFLRDGEEKIWSFKNTTSEGIQQEGTSDVNKANGTEEQETETVYISVDLNSGSYKEKLDIDKNAIFQHSGLDRDHPLIRIGDKLYEGTWQKLLGTELAFPDSASINRREGATGSETVGTEADVDTTSTDLKKSNRHDQKHTEKIYRITDRLTLRGVEPM